MNPRNGCVVVARDHRSDRILGHAAGFGNARDLVLGGRRADVGIEAGGRRRDQLDRDRGVAVCLPLGVDARGNGIDQRLRARGQVGSAGHRRS